MMEGWIKLHRSLIEWEWYDDIPTKVVWLHLLMTANHEDNTWHGIEIKRGQKLTSNQHLADETHLSVQNVRTALKHLKSTGEITIQSTNKHSLITIEKWEDFQQMDGKANKQKTRKSTNSQQATNKQLTTNKNDKNEKNEKNIYIGLSDDLISAIQGFVEMRKKMKKPLTDRALELQIKSLKNLTDINSPEAIAIVNQSVERGWMSFYPLKQGTAIPQTRAAAEDVRKKNEAAVKELKVKLEALKNAKKQIEADFEVERNQDNFKRLADVRADIARVEDLIKKGESKL